MIEEVVKKLYNKEITPEDLNEDLIQATFDSIDKEARKGYGKMYYNLPADGKGTLPLQLAQNIYMFSGAKTYAQLKEINKLMYNSQGQMVPFNQFAQLAKQTNRTYNLNWLQAEYQTARTAAQMAQKWQSFEENADLFPNLKFRTVGDDRVRDKHKTLDGIIRPLNDPFWKKHYPPLDWRCRCEVVQTAENSTSVPEELPPVQFKGNVGIDGEIFTSKGNFFKLVNSEENAERNLELMKLKAPNRLVYENGVQKVSVNIFTDIEQYEENVKTAMQLAKGTNARVTLRPLIDESIVKDFNNLSFDVNKQLGNKYIPADTNYRALLEESKNKDADMAIIDLSFNNEPLDNAVKSINELLIDETFKDIKTIYIISSDHKQMKTIKR